MASNTMSKTDQLEYAEKNLEIMLEWNGRYDNKLILILGINTAILGVIFSLAPPYQAWTPSIILSLICTFLALGASYIFIYMGSYPRIRGPEKSLWYFGSISKIKYQEYEKTYIARNMDDHLIDILKQCYRNSEILCKKFDYLKLAYKALLVSVLTWVITIFQFKTI